VKTPARSVTPIVAVADLVLSATLVAVIVNELAVEEENVADVVEGVPLKLPPDFVQVTPAAPTSFMTLAVNVSACESVSPPDLGLMETIIDEPACVTALAVLEYPLLFPAASVARTR
jgi:hypothetical protein